MYCLNVRAGVFVCECVLHVREYTSPMGVTPLAQAWNKTEINEKFSNDVKHHYTVRAGDELEPGDDDRQAVPMPLCYLFDSGSRVLARILPIQIWRRPCCMPS